MQIEHKSLVKKTKKKFNQDNGMTFRRHSTRVHKKKKKTYPNLLHILCHEYFSRDIYRSYIIN